MGLAEGLEEFVATVDHGSLTAAAAELGLPRATLSRRLARLEQSLGVRLLHRTTRRLSLTREGTALYGKARYVVETARAVRDEVARLDGRPRGVLRVSVPSEIPQELMARSLESFLDDHACILGYAAGSRPSTSWPTWSGGQLPVSGVLAANQMGIRLQAALQGMGIAMVVERMATEPLADGRLVPVLPDVLGRTERVCLGFANRTHLDPKIRAFVDFMAERVTAAQTEIRASPDGVPGSPDGTRCRRAARRWSLRQVPICWWIRARAAARRGSATAQQSAETGRTARVPRAPFFHSELCTCRI